MKNKKQASLQWKQLPEELQKYFFKHFLYSIVSYLLIFMFLITTHMTREFICMIILCTVYLGYVINNYFMVVRNKVKVCEGICESLNTAVTEVKVPFTLFRKKKKIYGKSTIVVNVDDYKCIIPVNSNFMASEGNEIRFYFPEQNIFQKGDNYFYISNPLLVVVSKL